VRCSLVDRDGRVPDVRRLAHDGRCDGVVVADAQLAVEVVEGEQFAVGLFFCLVCNQLAAQPVDLLDELVALGTRCTPKASATNSSSRSTGCAASWLQTRQKNSPTANCSP